MRVHFKLKFLVNAMRCRLDIRIASGQTTGQTTVAIMVGSNGYPRNTSTHFFLPTQPPRLRKSACGGMAHLRGSPRSRGMRQSTTHDAASGNACVCPNCVAHRSAVISAAASYQSAETEWVVSALAGAPTLPPPIPPPIDPPSCLATHQPPRQKTPSPPSSSRSTNHSSMQQPQTGSGTAGISRGERLSHQEFLQSVNVAAARKAVIKNTDGKGSPLPVNPGTLPTADLLIHRAGMELTDAVNAAAGFDFGFPSTMHERTEHRGSKFTDAGGQPDDVHSRMYGSGGGGSGGNSASHGLNTVRKRHGADAGSGIRGDGGGGGIGSGGQQQGEWPELYASDTPVHSSLTMDGGVSFAVGADGGLPWLEEGLRFRASSSEGGRRGGARGAGGRVRARARVRVVLAVAWARCTVYLIRLNIRAGTTAADRASRRGPRPNRCRSPRRRA